MKNYLKVWTNDVMVFVRSTDVKTLTPDNQASPLSGTATAEYIIDGELRTGLVENADAIAVIAGGTYA